MDNQIERYQAIVIRWLEVFVQHRQYVPDSEYQLVTDTLHHHYQVIRTGWLNDHYQYKVVFHLQIKPPEKVWILANNTDLLLTDDLIALGIPASDIVIGFLPDSMRALSGFAVA